MKIAVVTPGRSHLLNMSKQLLKRGHEVTFYTMVPKSRCQAFGLPRENVVSFFYICAPLMWIFRNVKLPFDWNRLIYYYVVRIVDYLTCLNLKKCDILIGISGCAVKSAQKAKRKYNSLFFVDRGCKHILTQDEILKSTPNARRVFQLDIPNELYQYDFADKIILPSIHSRESFENNGINCNKLFVNPYGVNIDLFKPTILKENAYDVIIVGIWTLRKGVDILVEACKQANLSLLHVGPLSDYPFPDDSRFVHIDPVNEDKLPEYYSLAKIFCLPSREDGFGLVLFQAMACGLPLVYSHETGGPDLKKLVNNNEYLFEIESYNVSSLAKSLKLAVEKSKSLPHVRNYLSKEDLNQITWDAYGNRYDDFLKNYSRKNG